MQNLDSVAQEISELCSILRLGGHFFWAAILFFKILSKFVQTVLTNLHSKSGVCSSKNEQVMALGTKEDGHLSIIYIQAIIQSKLHFSYSQSLDKRAKTQIK